MAWTEVKISGSRGKPRITIRKTGQIGFNGTLVEKYQIKRFKSAKLLIDNEDHKIGLRLYQNETEENTTPIIFKPGNVYVSARPLFNTYGISPLRVRAETVEFEEETNIISADLKDLD